MKKRKREKRVRRIRCIISAVLCFAMVLGAGIGFSGKTSYAVDIGTNPTPEIDIVVSMPSDYPGTFLDFKAEMTEKLIAAGVPEDKFRITDPAVKIDTTDLSGWYVYDHYYNESTYNSMGMDSTRQPYAAADNSQTGSTGLTMSWPVTITDYIAAWRAKNGATSFPNKCANLKSHSQSVMEENGTASIYFMGYGTNALTDYLFYPAAKDTRRTMSFNIEASVVDTHTLQGAGYLLNTGVDASGNLQGYVFYYLFSSATSGTAYIAKLKGVNASTTMRASLLSNNYTVVSSKAFTLPSDTKKIRVTAELNKNKVTLQQQDYKADGTLSDATDMFRDQALDVTGFNGVGPIVSYKSHGCSSLSAFTFTDVVMTYDANAFDALQSSQYYEGADQKYFINLGNTKGEASIPEQESAYVDGIKRLNDNGIFYISNVNDGRVLSEPEWDEEGNVTNYGLGAENGCYATSSGYVDQMVEYIAKNYRESAEFNYIQFDNQIPLSDFYVIMKDADGNEVQQVMTIHKQHLVVAPEGTTVTLNIHDKSKTSANGTKITGWRYKVYNPNGDVVLGSDNWLTSADQIPDLVVDKNVAEGKWTFELTVKDDTGEESTICQTYMTVFLDNEEPEITVENSPKKNGSLGAATITLTDQGYGIEDDGITMIEGEGSGIAYYCVNADAETVPSEEDWIKLKTPVHEYTFIEDMDDWATTGLAVWTKDECGNVANTQVFKSCHVTVLDQYGDVQQDYYTIRGTDLNDLPEADATYTNEEGVLYYFSGWVDQNGNPITEGTKLGDDVSEITIRPEYGNDMGTLAFDANGGTLAGTTSFEVPAGISLRSAVRNYEKYVTPTREGYEFTGWTTDVDGENEIGTERIVKDETTTVYAQWQIKEYKLIFNPNGGRTGATSSKSIEYGAAIAKTITDVTGRFAPTRDGYNFKGWSLSKDSTTLIAETDTLNMPADDFTVYAVWEKDTTKFIVTYDVNTEDPNASVSVTPATQEYLKNLSTVTSYSNMPTATRSGYDFLGWYYTDGDENETKAEDGTLFTSTAGKEDHTLVAKWKEAPTNYYVQYYINSGNVIAQDDEGNDIYDYLPVNALTKTYKETTGETVTVSDSDILAELKNGENGLTRDYWYNEENTGNILEGTVIGSPYLQLKLYYDRYFKVDVTTAGQGSTNAADLTKVKEGEAPTVTWAPADGYYVSKVVVDGKVRDDLCDAGEYTYPDGFHENHTVRVEFSKEADKPAENPENTDPKFYTVSTSLEGCIDGSCTITDSQRLEEGANTNVKVELADGYRITGVTVDGIEYTDYDELTGDGIEFTGLKSDHSVAVKVEKLPSMGGETSEGHYTVTVNRYGGGLDEDGTDVTVSPNAVVNKGDSYRVDWKGNKKYEVYKVLVDGEEVDTSYVRFNNIRANHVVDVYFREIPEEGDTPGTEPVIPSYGEEEYIKVNAKIAGGTGEIIGNAAIEKNQDYQVSWTVDSNDKVDPDSPDYTYYVVESVTVNGENIDGLEPDLEGKYLLENLTEDTEVIVNVKPVIYSVDLYKYGQGTISTSKTMYKGQNYLNIKATPDTGWVIAKIEVDGTVQYLNETPTAAPAESAEPVTEENTDEGSSSVLESPAPDGTAADEPGENLTEKEAVPAEEIPAEETADDAADTEDSKKPEENGSFFSKVIERLTSSAMFTPLVVKAAGEGDPLEPDMMHEDLTSYEGTSEELTVAVENISDDHEIKVWFTALNNEDPENPTIDPIPDPESSYKVSAKFIDKATGNTPAGGTIEGKGIVGENGDAALTWILPDGYKLDSVTVNDKATDEIEGAVLGENSLQLQNITSDMDVKIYVVKDTPGDTDVPDGDFKVQTYTIETDLQGSAGTITNSSVRTEGDSMTVKWSVTPVEGHDYKVKYVFVDGEPRTDLVEDYSGSITFEDIASNHRVLVVIYDKIPTNVDIDGDGEPDINIDDDGDGDPDVDVDTDEDGIPDINIDTDDDGEPDINIDTNEDGIPDINIDTDGDGIPDINIDTNEDGIPDINIDTNGDGIPDINIDTDGDGIPDKNVDVNGDGVYDERDWKKDDKTVKTVKTASKTGSAQTGDTGMIWLWTLICIAAAMAAGIFSRKRFFRK